jgi:hypothetical protein
MSENLRVTCPCCGATLSVATATGDVVTFDAPREAPKSFEDAVGDMQSGRVKRDDAFSKAFDRTRRLEQILDQKFQEARKKADGDPTPPKRAFDDD